MPGHDQTDDRFRRRRALAWLRFAAWIALIAIRPGEVRGQAGTPVAWNGREASPITLTADRIQTWTDEGAFWVLLEDQATATQGDVSLSAQGMVAKIIRGGRSSGQVHRVELYARGNVHDPGQPDLTFPEIRTHVVTVEQVKLSSTKPGGIHDLKKPPRALPIVTRAFPPRQPAPAAGEAPAASDAMPPAATDADPAGRRVEQASAPQVITPTMAIEPVDQPAAPAPDRDAPPLAMPFGAPAATAPPAEVSQTPTAAPPVPLPASVPTDAAVQPAQAVGTGPGFPDDFAAPPTADPLPQDPNSLPLAPNSVPLGPSDDPLIADPPTTLLPLPDGTPRTLPGISGPPGGGNDANIAVLPGSQRLIEILPRSQTEIQSLDQLADGTQVYLIRNGVNITTRTSEQGIIDLEADNIVIWIRGEKGNPAQLDPTSNKIITKSNQPIEFYLEGHVVVRQDQQRIQGKSDQKTYKADRAYYDLQKEQMLVIDAQLELFAPGLITPMKLNSPRIFQYHPTVNGPDGQPVLSKFSSIQADKTVTTGSRFANPGYRFTSNSVNIDQVIDTQAVPSTTGAPFDQNDLTWQIDARQNFFYFGRVPVFYWPRFFVEADDLDPPLQGLSFGTNNYFGQQVRADFDVFNIFNIRHLPEIDVWNFDLDYLSARDKSPGQGIALGNEIGWFGTDLLRDISDPYHKNKATTPSRLGAYAGYFDAYGLFDGSRDVLGGGLAIITNGTNNNAAGRAGFGRISNPTYQNFRGRVTARHMQSLTTPDTPFDEDFRVNVEVGFFSDRNFLEQYFKRLFDTGLDQENLIYVMRQKQNQAFTFQTEINLQTFNTETQWFPKADYYRIGDSFLNNRLNYYQHTGADYANVHTAAEVNNRTLFNFLPTDPISNTNRTFESGRIFTTHELDLPLNFQFIRVTPYLQGQAIGWNNQIQDHAVGRLWGAAGARADVTFWKVYEDAESELFNVHGLNHKIDLVADFRDAYSNVPLNSVGVQDDLDDNTYEYTRRYFALTNYVGGILPPQYDPRFLMLRRAISPITGTTDVQASIETLKLGIHQRLQTKRGQEGKRHINDYMVFDLDTTYFPNAARDNFNKPFGQNFYNYEWYLGDRTSFVSYGWFEFFKIAGNPTTVTNNNLRNDPFGLHIVTSGISITRIPKGNVFIGYTIVNTGPISTSALNTSYSYWLSPKWFGTAGSSYDFGNDLLLAATGSLTRIGADYLTSVGLTVSPIQHSYQFVFEISPRLSPNLRAGSSSGLTRLDSRFAPVE